MSVPLSSGLTWEKAEPIDESDPDVIELRRKLADIDRALNVGAHEARNYLIGGRS